MYQFVMKEMYTQKSVPVPRDKIRIFAEGYNISQTVLRWLELSSAHQAVEVI